MAERWASRGTGVWALVLVAAMLGALGAACRAPEPGRGVMQAEAGGPVTVAAVWPWRSRTTLLFGAGLQLAVDEINTAGGVLGRPVTVLREDDHESVDHGRLAAQRLAQNRDVVAVIGHMQSYVSLPAAAIYDLSGLVHVAPVATDPRLTQQGYRRLFRVTITDRETGVQMADYAASRRYRRVGIYYIRNAYGQGLANAFEEQAIGQGISIVDRQSYDPNAAGGERQVADILTSWRDLHLDAIFAAAEPRQGAAMIRAARAMGIVAPVLGGDALAVGQFLELGGAAVEGTVVAAMFHPDDPRPAVRRFGAAFRQRHGSAPDASAALAYDALYLLARGMRSAASTEPNRLAAALHAAETWDGVTGSIRFTETGDLVDRSVGAVQVRGGEFVWLGVMQGGVLEGQ